MSGSGAVSRTHGGDRFYNPPAVRLQQQLLLQQIKSPPLKPEEENRTDSDSSDGSTALSKTPSVWSTSSPPPVTNLERFIDSVTPSVQAQFSSEANKSWRGREPESHLYYSLSDLWDSFGEWSVYGVGVPLVLNGEESIEQYYVPFLSGLQLYVDPMKPPLRSIVGDGQLVLSENFNRRIENLREDEKLTLKMAVGAFLDLVPSLFTVNCFRSSSSPSSLWCFKKRRPGEESNVRSSRETSSGGSSDCEADKRSAIQQSNSNSLRKSGLPSREKSIVSSSSDEAEASHSPGTLVFEYMENEPPFNRKSLADKVSALASQFPELRKYKSCDLLPSSWISVAWYPIYRIPVGPTLKDLDACFLTFHSLSTNSKSSTQPQSHGAGGKKHGFGTALSVPLPVFGLASYKLKGSILSPSGPLECQKEDSLLEAADSWLRNLHVYLHDYQFFLSHYSYLR